MTIMPLLAGIAFSIGIIAWLWHSDAKRRRVAGLPPVSTGSDKRRIMAIAGLLPGLIFAAQGDSASVLVWLGSCVIGGWLVSQLRN
jgi:hypothetical protein